MINERLKQTTGLVIDEVTPTQLIASMPDPTTKFGKRYGHGETEQSALSSLILNATGRHPLAGAEGLH